ncbi:hypothetical protein KSS87_018209 [Heliosperma pusillum]|nr:hypothetical protein KSS87_018209 [Heliosperma pusillum]
MEERLEFEKTQLGVKGLLDRGGTQIPNMCRYPPYELISELPPIADDGKLIPIVDLADPRPLTVGRIYDASREVGDPLDKWTAAVKGLSNRLIKLLSQGLGLSEDRLKGDNYLGRMDLIRTYFPYCPSLTKHLDFVRIQIQGCLA